MAQPVSEPHPRAARAAVVAAGIAAVLIALTGVLWAHYGTAVFYEMIVAGIAMCL